MKWYKKYNWTFIIGWVVILSISLCLWVWIYRMFKLLF